MATLNQIQLGTTIYDIEDSTARELINNINIDSEVGTKIDEVEAKIETKQDILVNGENIKTINGESILGNGNIIISGNGESITIDAELNDTSENPVQNKVVNSAIKSLHNGVNNTLETLYVTKPQLATELDKKQGVLSAGTNVEILPSNTINVTIPDEYATRDFLELKQDKLSAEDPIFVYGSVIGVDIHNMATKLNELGYRPIYKHHITTSFGDTGIPKSNIVCDLWILSSNENAYTSFNISDAINVFGTMGTYSTTKPQDKRLMIMDVISMYTNGEGVTKYIGIVNEDTTDDSHNISEIATLKTDTLPNFSSHLPVIDGTDIKDEVTQL